MVMEERVSAGRLKARLSEYLRRAKAGAGVVVTDRWRPGAGEVLGQLGVGAAAPPAGGHDRGK
jgi:signal recognition particle GTPase